jgi:hemerythrin
MSRVAYQDASFRIRSTVIWALPRNLSRLNPERDSNAQEIPMETKFQWTAEYSVRNAAMDSQHKQLFGIIRKLHTAMRSGHGKDVLSEVLRRLVDYTLQNFAAEENLVMTDGSPQLITHRAEHKAPTDKVLAFKKDCDAGAYSNTPDLMKFLENWLTHHIQNVDQKYGEFLSAKGVQ